MSDAKLPMAVLSMVGVLLLSSCVETDDEPADPQYEDHDTSATEEPGNGDENGEGDPPIPSLDEHPEPHLMTYGNREEIDWYLFAPEDYHDAGEWETSPDSPTYGTSPESIDEFSCGLGSVHYQGNWKTGAELGSYLPEGYEVEVVRARFVEEGIVTGGTEASVFLSIPCETWTAAVESYGINPDLYPRQIILTEEAAASLMSIDDIAEQILLQDPDAPDIRSEEVELVFFRPELVTE